MPSAYISFNRAVDPTIDRATEELGAKPPVFIASTYVEALGVVSKAEADAITATGKDEIIISREEGLKQAAEAEAALERGLAALEEAKPLIRQLSENPAFVEALAAEGEQIDPKFLEETNGNKQEETPSGTEERGGPGSLGEAQS